MAPPRIPSKVSPNSWLAGAGGTLPKEGPNKSTVIHVSDPMPAEAGGASAILRTPLQERRIGRFRVPQKMLLEPHIGRAFFREMIVMRAEASFVDETLMVWADHPQFEIMVSGEMVPEYVAEITAPKGIPPRRHQDLVVRWRLSDVGERHMVAMVARMQPSNAESP